MQFPLFKKGDLCKTKTTVYTQTLKGSQHIVSINEYLLILDSYCRDNYYEIEFYCFGQGIVLTDYADNEGYFTTRFQKVA